MKWHNRITQGFSPGFCVLWRQSAVWLYARKSIPELPCASTWYPFSVPTRYAGAIQTWRSTPILQYSNSPSIRAAGFEDEDEDDDDDTRTKRLVRASMISPQESDRSSKIPRASRS